MSRELLNPIPQELATVSAKAGLANTLAGDTVQQTIERLERARQQLVSGEHPDQLLALSSFLKTSNAKVATAHKEWASGVTKFGKTVDKKFSTPLLPLFPPTPYEPIEPPGVKSPKLAMITSNGGGGGGGASGSSPLALAAPTSSFGSPAALAALNQTIALHLARIGAFASLDSFLAETGAPAPPAHTLADLRALHSILSELGRGVCTQALAWVQANPDADPDRDLEFELRKEEYIRILLHDTDLSGSSDPLIPRSLPDSPSKQIALHYAGSYFARLWTDARAETICALSASPLYMPFTRLLASPYAPIFAEYAVREVSGGRPPESRLQLVFAAAFLRKIELPRDSPLTVVTDVGGGGAMARIQKVRTVMKEKKTEWSAVGELPVEIPLPTTHRYHSIFACPVSKEQSTASNPPMLLPCGHVIARESLGRLARGTATLKCPYCPVVSNQTAAVRVHF
ncbi:hypothetical protein RQP46_003864 [Phenoliferia psychrophenolica]